MICSNLEVKGCAVPTVKNHTNGELLWYSLHFHLGRLKIQGRKGVLTDEDRRALCDSVLADLRRFNRWLDQEAPQPFGPAPPFGQGPNS
jgi:hypothetical protein